MMEVMMPRSGAPCTAGTGVIDLPSKLATPSSVPIHKTPSELCASAITDDCGSPRQLDLLNVRNARVGAHSSPRAKIATSAIAHAMTATRDDLDMGVTCDFGQLTVGDCPASLERRRQDGALVIPRRA